MASITPARAPRSVNESPGFASIRAFVTYEDVFRQTATPRYLELLLGRMGAPDVLGQLGGIAQILQNNPIIALDPSQQRKLIHEFEHDIPWIKRLGELITKERRVLVHDAQIAMLARAAILYSPPEFTNPSFGEEFVRALLVINSLNGRTHGVNDGSAKAFLAIETQSLMLSDERLMHLLYRNDRFFAWLSALDQNDRDYLDVDMKRMTGFTYQEYTAASFAFFTQFLIAMTSPRRSGSVDTVGSRAERPKGNPYAEVSIHRDADRLDSQGARRRRDVR